MVKYPHDVDLDLIRQAQQGDADSAAILAERTQVRVYAYIHRLTLNPHMAEDLCQETMLRLISSLPGLEFADVRFFWAWVYKTALSRVQDHLRREKYKLRSSGPLQDRMESQAQTDDDAGLHNLVREELLAAMWRAMQRLNLRYRNILALRCLDGLSYAEIAAATGGSELAAKLLFFRAKQSLQRQLARDGFGRSSLLSALGLFAAATAPTGQKAAAATALSAVSLHTTAGTAALATATSKAAVVVLCAAAGLGAIATTVRDSPLPASAILMDSYAANEVFSYPTTLLGSRDPDGSGFQQASGRPPTQVGPAGSLASILVGKPSSQHPCLALPPRHWVELGFKAPIMDGPGPDILIEGWGCRVQRVFVTDGGPASFALPLVSCEGSRGQFGILAFDLAQLKVPFEIRTIRIEGCHYFTPTEPYRLSSVRARTVPVGSQ